MRRLYRGKYLSFRSNAWQLREQDTTRRLSRSPSPVRFPYCLGGANCTLGTTCAAGDAEK